MRRLLQLLLLMIVLSPSLALSQWSHEPSGSSVVYDCNFSNTLCGMTTVYNTQWYESPGGTGSPLSPPYALTQTLAANSAQGDGQYVLNLNHPTQLFIGTWWQTNCGFEGTQNNSNKMVFARNPAIDNNLLTWYGLPNAAKKLMWFGQMTYSNCGKPGTFGMCWPTDGTGWFNPNTADASRATVAACSGWHKIEIYLKTSTTASSSDGIVRIWVDDYLTSDYTTINLTPGGITEFQINAAWDGSSNYACPGVRDCSKTWKHWYDHLHISIPDCPLGCAGGGPSAPPPPPASPPASPPPPPPSSGDYVYQSQFSGTQGGSQWSYRDTSGALLTYNSSQVKWDGDELYLAIWNSGFHHGATGSHKGPVLRWTAPEAGTARITGTFALYQPTSASGVVTIKHNATTIFSQSMALGVSYPYDITRSMANGDTIDFSLAEVSPNQNDNTQLNPVISWSPTSAAAPTVSGLSPTSGAVGTTVTITGTNFIPSLSGNTVTFSNIAATVTAATATSITAIVPPHALTGTVKVINIQGTGTSGSSFTVPLSGVVETVSDVSASATGQTSVQVQFTALSDGAGLAAKHDVRIAQGVIAWGLASGVASGTCSTPYAPGVTNTVVTCTITGLTKGTQYSVQLVPYKGTLNVDAVFGNISNVATVTTQGDIIDVPEICSRPLGDAMPVSYTCPRSHGRLIATP